MSKLLIYTPNSLNLQTFQEMLSHNQKEEVKKTSKAKEKSNLTAIQKYVTPTKISKLQKLGFNMLSLIVPYLSFEAIRALMIIIKGAKESLPIAYAYLESLKKEKNLRLAAFKPGTQIWLNA